MSFVHITSGANKVIYEPKNKKDTLMKDTLMDDFDLVK